jgi:outer membrane protein assembly factor BamA
MRYVVQLGDPVRVGGVRVRVVPDTPAALRRRLSWLGAELSGRVAAVAAVEAFLDSLAEAARSCGYPAAEAELADVTVEGERAWLEAVLICGEAARVDTVVFQGAERSRQGFLRRWAGIGLGEVLSDALLQEAARRLQQLAWLELLEVPRRQRLPDGRWAAVFVVRERSASRLEGILAYGASPGSGSGWNGMVEAQLGNLFGSGRSVAVRWYRTAMQLQELWLAYEEPVPPLWGVRGQYRLRQQDTAYAEEGWQLELRWLGHLAARWTAGGFLGRQETKPAGVVRLVVPSRTWSAGVEFGLWQLDFPENPAAGVLLRVCPSYRWQWWGEGFHRRSSRGALEADGEFYRQLLFPVVARFHGHVRILWGRELRWEEFYRIGGVSSMRGYREAQFTVPKAGWFGVELRWLLGRREHVGVFLDSGWLDGVGWRVGGGIQWQLSTAIGTLQLQLSWGNGDGVRQAKLGVRVVNAAL